MMNIDEAITAIRRTPGVTAAQAMELALWLADVAPCPACWGNGHDADVFSQSGEYQGYVLCPVCGGCGIDLDADWTGEVRERLEEGW